MASTVISNPSSTSMCTSKCGFWLIIVEAVNFSKFCSLTIKQCRCSSVPHNFDAKNQSGLAIICHLYDPRCGNPLTASRMRGQIAVLCHTLTSETGKVHCLIQPAQHQCYSNETYTKLYFARAFCTEIIILCSFTVLDNVLHSTIAPFYV